MTDHFPRPGRSSIGFRRFSASAEAQATKARIRETVPLWIVCFSLVLCHPFPMVAQEGERKAAESSPERLPRENLLVYRGEDGKVHPVRTVAQWRQRREEIVGAMEQVMGSLPDRSECEPLDVRIEEEIDRGSYLLRSISYVSEKGGRVPAYLTIPKKALTQNAAPVPAVLCLHPTDHRIGRGVVVGLGGLANRQYAQELAERGYVTLAPNYPHLADYRPPLKERGWESGTLKAVWDNIRGLDLLESLPYVRKDGFGVIGHSLGGHNAVFTAVFDRRLVAVVSSCGLDSFLDYYDGDPEVWQAGRGWTQERYMPKLAEYRGQLEAIPFDFHEILGALAPRSVLVIAPKEDHNFRAKSVDRIAAAAVEVYELFDRPEALRVVHPAGGHDFPAPMRRLAYSLFDRVLRNAPSEEESPSMTGAP
jgi:dienelactone hydrolase